MVGQALDNMCEEGKPEKWLEVGYSWRLHVRGMHQRKLEGISALLQKFYLSLIREVSIRKGKMINKNI